MMDDAVLVVIACLCLGSAGGAMWSMARWCERLQQRINLLELRVARLETESALADIRTMSLEFPANDKG